MAPTLSKTPDVLEKPLATFRAEVRAWFVVVNRVRR